MNNKNYKFVKVRNCDLPNMKYEQWYLYCDNTETLIDWWKTCARSHIKDGMNNLMGISTRSSDNPSHSYAAGAIALAQAKGISTLEAAVIMENDIINNMLRYLSQGKILLLTSGIAHMFLSGFDVIAETHKSIIDFEKTKFTMDDVRILKWDNGSHFYAKVGRYDVVDEFQNQKWDTEDEARGKAIVFISDLNR